MATEPTPRQRPRPTNYSPSHTCLNAGAPSSDGVTVLSGSGLVAANEGIAGQRHGWPVNRTGSPTARRKCRCSTPPSRQGDCAARSPPPTAICGALTAGGLEVRSYNFPLVERIVLTERVAYVTHYRSDQHGWDTLVRNGVRAKTVLTGVGSVEIAIPRDRGGGFQPQIVKALAPADRRRRDDAGLVRSRRLLGLWPVRPLPVRPGDASGGEARGSAAEGCVKVSVAGAKVSTSGLECSCGTAVRCAPRQWCLLCLTDECGRRPVIPSPVGDLAILRMLNVEYYIECLIAHAKGTAVARRPASSASRRRDQLVKSARGPTEMSARRRPTHERQRNAHSSA
ncbi:transposase [Streptomyces sp. AM2-3-1]